MIFFFHLRGGAADVPDEEGLELPTEAAARQRALEGARSIIAAEVLEGRLSLAERIDVEDGDGILIFSLPFAEAVTRS